MFGLDSDEEARFDWRTTLGHPRFNSEQIVRLGKELYERSIRASVENDKNTGKLVSIDIETGDYEIGTEKTGNRIWRIVP